MNEKLKLQIALQLYYERKYKGDVKVKVGDGCLPHLFSIHVSIDFNDFKMFSYFDLLDFYTAKDLEQEIKKCNEALEQSYEHQINMNRSLIKE